MKFHVCYTCDKVLEYENETLEMHIGHDVREAIGVLIKPEGRPRKAKA